MSIASLLNNATAFLETVLEVIAYRVDTGAKHDADKRFRHPSIVHLPSCNRAKEGYFSRLRGSLQARPGAAENTFTFVSGGTLTSAMKMAAEMDASNLYVVKLKKDGLPNVVILHAQTPLDVLRMRRFKANDFHSGATTNIFEVTG